MAKDSFDPQDENIFDFIRRQAESSFSNDYFQGTDLVLCRVLKVFTIPPKGRTRWIDQAFGANKVGDKRKMFAFKGRVVESTGGLTIHSAYPDPEEYGVGLGGTPPKVPTEAEKKKYPFGKGPAHGFIDMFPTIIGADDQPPKIGDIVLVEFPTKYPEAGGEWYGIYRGTPRDKAGVSIVMNTGTPDPRKKFDATMRISEAKNFAPLKDADLPVRFVFVGDELVSNSANAADTYNDLANQIKSAIGSLYDNLAKIPQYSQQNKILGNKNKKKVEKAKGKFRKSYDHILGTAITNELISKVEGLRVPRSKDLRWASIAINHTDGTYYDPALKSKYYSGRRGKFKWKREAGIKGIKNIEAQIVSGADMTKQIPNLKLNTGEGKEFDFAIVGTQGATSAVPGWAGTLEKSTIIDFMATEAWGGEKPQQATKIEYQTLQKYAHMVADLEPESFFETKKKQFKAMAEELKKSGIKRGIWIGPPVVNGSDKVHYSPKKKMRGKKELNKEVRLETSPEGVQYLKFETGKNVSAKTANSPYFYSNHEYRRLTSHAISSALQDAGLDEKKFRTCLAYTDKTKINEMTNTSSDSMIQKSAKSLIVSEKYKNLGHKKFRQAYVHWVLQQLVRLIIGGETANKQTVSTSSEDFWKDILGSQAMMKLQSSKKKVEKSKELKKLHRAQQIILEKIKKINDASNDWTFTTEEEKKLTKWVEKSSEEYLK